MFLLNIVGLIVGTILAFLLNVIDRIWWFVFRSSPIILPGHRDDVMRAVIAPQAPVVRGETQPRRNAMHPTLMGTPENSRDITTIDRMFRASATRFPTRMCMSFRSLKEIVTGANGWQTLSFNESQSMTFGELQQRVRFIASGLLQLGLRPQDNFGLYEDTRAEWMQTFLACQASGIVAVTVYANLGIDAVVHAINECEISVVLTNAKLVDQLLKRSPDMPTLKHLVVLDGRDDMRSSVPSVSIITFNQLIERGSQSNVPIREPLPEDVAVIMYTSGSTGTPKGVIMRNSSVVATISSAAFVLGLSDQHSDIYLAYLPLAHVLEMMAETAVLAYGGCICYGTPRSLASAIPRGDLAEYRPTIMAGVPKTFDTIRKGVDARNEKSNFIVRWLFNTALQAKIAAVAAHRDTPLWNALVFSRAKQAMGGRMRRLLSGGAPLHFELQNYIRCVFCCPIGQGYGLTETCGGACIQTDPDLSTSALGGPLPACEIKLVDVPDMNYLSTDKPLPRGEVCISGLNISSGYYKQPALTAESYRQGPDGKIWFYTGDIAQFNENGTLSIIDRKKNLIKTRHGEYIATEKLEAVYCGCPFVLPNGVCVIADPYQDIIVGLVLPDRNRLNALAAELSVPNADFAAVCANPRINAIVLESLQKVGVEGKLKPFEKLAKITIIPDEWTPENQMLTAVQKLNRTFIYKHYADAIKGMFPPL
eukprot:gnl/Spiro4/7307_TR3823_c0_g1_i1.p1 gnl/Spiro4/7307_TR3823_c0_g1~~gnl/Spiro4/7307_TR3823_c0_g1_i1.p1  ORF type:complete len:721 (+),score=217.50 gnl/Spiro4/7307_TR3823_c0_g1_i1:48-2165(+)